MEINKDLIQKFYQDLISKKIISKDDVLFENDDLFDFNSEIIKELISKDYKLIYNESDNGLYYIDSSGEEIRVPEVDDGIERTTLFLVDRIPQYTFNTDEDSTNFKTREVENIYISTVVSSIFGDVFKDEVEELIENYDFNDIDSYDSTDGTFTGLVNSWSELQSKSLQAVISACKEQIATKKEQFSSLNLSKISKEERLKLNVLKDDIKNYFNNFKREKLKDDIVSVLKKHEFYKLLDQRDTHIRENIIMDKSFDDVRMIYFIDKLNYEDVGVLTKKRIQNVAKLQVAEMYEDQSVGKAVVTETTTKFLQKGIKVFLRKWKNDQLDLYLEDRANYKLPSKG